MAIKIKRDTEKVNPTRGRKWGEFAEAVVAEFEQMKKGQSFTLPCKGLDKAFAMRQVLNRLKKVDWIEDYRSNYDDTTKDMRIWKL